jgi:hypothetical protein
VDEKWETWGAETGKEIIGVRPVCPHDIKLDLSRMKGRLESVGVASVTEVTKNPALRVEEGGTFVFADSRRRHLPARFIFAAPGLLLEAGWQFPGTGPSAARKLANGGRRARWDRRLPRNVSNTSSPFR